MEQPTRVRKLPRVLNVEDVATVLELTPAAVRRLLLLRQLPGRKVGKRWRIPRDRFESFLAGDK